MYEIENQTDPLRKHRVLTTKDVAELCRVSLATVYRVIKLGRLRPLAGFGKALFSVEEIDRFLGVTRAGV